MYSERKVTMKNILHRASIKTINMSLKQTAFAARFIKSFSVARHKTLCLCFRAVHCWAVDWFDSTVRWNEGSKEELCFLLWSLWLSALISVRFEMTGQRRTRSVAFGHQWLCLHYVTYKLIKCFKKNAVNLENALSSFPFPFSRLQFLFSFFDFPFVVLQTVWCVCAVGQF